MQEDYEVIALAAFSVMQANVTNLREIVFDAELLLRFHDDNEDQWALPEPALEAEPFRFLVGNVNFHS